MVSKLPAAVLSGGAYLDGSCDMTKLRGRVSRAVIGLVSKYDGALVLQEARGRWRKGVAVKLPRQNLPAVAA